MQWLKKCYSRLLIDNHITDIKPEYMTKFDPAEYVRMVEISGVDSAMVYACCHNGNCYYPTKVGHQHANLKGRDIFGETIDLLNQKDIVPVAYYTVIYHNDSALSHPDWQMQDVNGKDHDRRYRFSCPNNRDYVEFVKQQLSEIAEYNVAGFFIDMTFWPMFCVCPACTEKYRRETGREIPHTIGWSSTEWNGFLRTRERWMAEFAQELTDYLKELNSELSVTHQFSPVLRGWLLGQSSGIPAASDYASGDFYGDKYQQRLGSKIFAAYTKNSPYEFMTSRCVNLSDHTSTKSEDELALHAETTLANGGACFFIDAINPDGTLNENIYQLFGRIMKRIEPFKDCIQRHVPDLTGETGLYFSMNSCTSRELDGVTLEHMGDIGNNMSLGHSEMVDEVIGTSVLLNRMKIPYRVITDTTTDLSEFKTIIINNIAYMSATEVERIREFVRNGGTLIATGMTSLHEPDGKSSGNLALSDVLGVSFIGKYTGDISYIDINGNDDPVSSTVPAPLVCKTTADVMGTVLLPDFPCNDFDQYASIHSNPPGIATEYVGCSVNRFGRGRAVYLNSSFLKHCQHSQQTFGEQIFREYVPITILNSDDLPACVELTLLKSTTQSGQFIIGLVNYQEELPNVPVHDIRLEMVLPLVPAKLIKISDGSDIDFTCEAGVTTFCLSCLKDAELIEVYPNLEEM